MCDMLDEIYVSVDDFCRVFLPAWQAKQLAEPNGQKRRQRQHLMTESEMLTILILFQRSSHKNFKAFYTEYVATTLAQAFPRQLSYNRFVELIPRLLVPFTAYLSASKQTGSGISFIDSTAIAVCHNKRISGHKVFKACAAKGKSSKGWFFGFKLHLVCSEKGELLNCMITPGNVDDRKPVQKLTENLQGKLFGDKGYISSELTQTLANHKLQLITGIRKNMKNKLLPIYDKILLLKRGIIESINNQLKNVFQLEHSRHRSPINGFISMMAAIAAYLFHPNKPAVVLNEEDLKILADGMQA